ncbi:MAG: DEAD/DEAH box helicase, partial [Cyanobacteria bacterium REEB65]|nr:DEAD/DEAH box helicase [Cyanobacteria bacterium REEB65]
VLQEDGEQLIAKLGFVYGTALPISPTDPRRAIAGEFEGRHGTWSRDPVIETAIVDRLARSGLEARANGVFLGWGDGALDFLLDEVPQLAAEGWEIFGEERLRSLRVARTPMKVRVTVSSGIDWFEIRSEIDPGDGVLDDASLRDVLRGRTRYVRLGSGQFARLPSEWLQRQRSLAHGLGYSGDRAEPLDAKREAVAQRSDRAEPLDAKREAVAQRSDRAEPLDTAMSPTSSSPGLVQRLPGYLALVADELLESADTQIVDARWQQFRDRLAGDREIAEQSVPAGFVGELRPYQRKGLDFLWFLREHGLHGVLADDMGLGKTIQAIALLQAEKEAGNSPPSLLVVPTSVIYNWEKELQRFSPGLKTLVLHGPGRRFEIPKIQETDVVITSFSLLRRD